ncbi:MAG: hypothetical protein V3T02_05150, partial [Alphaproteobacteria bacterium]
YIYRAALAAAVVTGAYHIVPAAADPIADFYKGKRMTILISSRAGSGYDVYARLLGRNLGRHIPGNPRIIPKNMPGAGGMRLLNHAYNKAPRNGSTLFTLHFNLPLWQAIGGSGVKYDASKIIGLGRLVASNAVVGVWSKSTSKVASLADAIKRQAIIGSTGATSNSTIYPIMLNNLLGSKFKVVHGYAGAFGVFLAMERGEIDGFGSYSYLSFKAVKPHYLEKKLFQPIVQWGPKREAGWPDIPTAIDLAKTAVDKKAMEIASSGPRIGFSYFMPPKVPKARVRALRAAFNAMVKDKAFLADAAKLKMSLRTATGQEIEKIVAGVMSAPADAIARLKDLRVRKDRKVGCKQHSKASKGKFCRKKRKRKKKK